MCMENGLPSDLLAMLTSQVWLRRNKLRMGEKVPDLRLLNSLVREAFQEFQHAHTVEPSHLSTRPQTKWKPSPMDWFKINFDGVVFQEKNEAGLVIIICDDHGLVMAALTQVIPLPTLLEMVEVLAARKALIFAKELTFDHIILKGDSNIAIHAMTSDVYSATSFDNAIYSEQANKMSYVLESA
ncbi:hypothetical protein CFP56_026054 [Quercus suber]|uniref:RNase H type-1 domain-containing protein n=1 Tax=Quercus suber TaxID=58331 RepID=A0AAW0K3C5_QUESU